MVILFIFSMFVGIVFGIGGGALMGWKIADKDLGESFAALMGSLFGSTAVIPGVIVGLIILFFFT